ncbi:putative WD repeat-containing protein-like protein [Hapsidospora chrysogenum ATCC 11550]|uniref:Putative WD repeat-containing protein-like protein n=1 Tax=Hapsidospora chrysogenum (strain ATCC 11550 / CBS 779.69 / DSM 880 / IAM 14645 / JCM 23072 / IMI 49137) TaxID=857340 RepID=A0A086STV2_HAPC1|nr:putative WD repeat-containing protein-like protein [Hapsidospora chrysogenum ATCC 11550]
MTSMITAAQWVPRGFAAPFPKKYELDESEYERIAELAKLQLDDAEDDLKEAQDNESGRDEQEGDGDQEMEVDGGKKSEKVNLDDDDLKEYNLDNYDDEDDAPGKGESMGIFGNVKNLAYYESNEEDPYITLKDGEDDEDEDRADLQILATDNLILSAKVEDELAHLEVYVYEDEADNLYVHHDIMLPAIPLAVEWIDLPVDKANTDKDARGNYVAIGTMDPDIEIWDLDTIDCMYPNAILGQGGNAGSEDAKNEKKKKKKKKNKSAKANDEYHVDAVLSLAANRQHRNLLASASADKTVKLWDLNTTKCAKSYSYHTDKVCSLAWHATEATVLLSGSYDRTVVAADMRAPDAKAPRWGVESDVENVRWDPHDANYFFVSTENGAVHYHDVRKAPSNPTATKSVWTLQAHDESVSSFDINPVIPGYMATGSSDRTVKLWNIQPSGPSMVVSRNLDVGKVFATTFAPDPEVAFRLAVAGSHGSMHVWDTSTNPSVRRAFAQRVPEQRGDAEDRLVGVDEDVTDSDSEEGEDVEGEEDDDSMDEV